MSATMNMDLLNALAAQLGREKVVAMCEAFLSTKAAPAAAAGKKSKEDHSGEAKPKRVLPFKLIQWQAFVRYAKEHFAERFEGVKGAPAMQQLCKTLKEEEGVWEAFEASPACPQPALEPAHAGGPAPAAEDSEDEVKEVKPKRKWSEEAKAAAKAKRAAKKAAADSSDSESVHSTSSGKKVKAE